MENFINYTSQQCDSCAYYVPLYVCLFGEFLEISDAGSCMRENSDVVHIKKCVRYCDGCELWNSAETPNGRKKEITSELIALKKIANELVRIANRLKK